MANIAQKIRIAQDQDGMLRRALERIIQLYTDKSHFVYELLQNAEDAAATYIRFIQYSDRLEVLHNGRPFTFQNLQGLCDIGKSDKVDDLNKIGEFGVGFKSVFGICETVKLYSAPEHFREKPTKDMVRFAVEIHDFTRPDDIPYEEMDQSYTTRFVFPYAVGQSFSGFASLDSLNRTLSQKLQNLGITTLLFMKNLELIEYQIEAGGSSYRGEYLLEKEIINDHWMKVSALGNTENKESQNGDDEIISYLKFSRLLPGIAQRTVDIAFAVREINGVYECIKAPNPYVSVYFPTETESKLDFIVQGPYRTTPNRSSIPADDPDNIFFAGETALLLEDSIMELTKAHIFNMSFVKALPLSEEPFQTFGLFGPLHSKVKRLFQKQEVIPAKDGGYVFAENARITRQEKLANLLQGRLLTLLINDGREYSWLPTYLTETNREYKHVLEFLTTKLAIPVIRPEDLRTLFVNNPQFLPACAEDWLVELYGILENIPASFSKTGYGANMLTCSIVKTTKGTFVPPYRKEGKAYIPNVFIQTKKVISDDIHYVDENLYRRCPHFFDDLLQIKEPNRYEFTIKSIKKRYGKDYVFDEEQHIADVKALVKFLKYEEYYDEVSELIRSIFLLRCKGGVMVNPSNTRVYLPINSDGVNIEGYYQNVIHTVSFLDIDFYNAYSIKLEALEQFGVKSSILVDENITRGTYFTYNSGRNPEWWTSGIFRWKLSIDGLKDVLKYISDHPSARDSILKSQAIVKVLLLNESRLIGDVHIGGSTPNLKDEPCEMIHVLRGEKSRGWDGRWVFTESGELASPKSITRHDMSTAIYGKINQDSSLFNLLWFKTTTADEVEALRKEITEEQIDALFESELRKRFGISSDDLKSKYGDQSGMNTISVDDTLPFPTVEVKSWDALKKHVDEMLIYAAPTVYEDRIRRIRVSNHEKEGRAYLQSMYRYPGKYKYACQLCHESCANFERVELFLKPEAELDPINLCLCPNCATEYRAIRSRKNDAKRIWTAILSKSESDISAEQRTDEHIAVHVDIDDELWFTETHFAEIRQILIEQELMKHNLPIGEENADEKTGVSVYEGYTGKTVHRADGFEGIVTKVDKDNLYVHVTNGKDAGKDIKIQLSFVIKNKNVYKFS